MKILTEQQRKYLDELKAEETEVLAKNATLLSNFTAICEAVGISSDKLKFKWYQKTGIVACYPTIVSILSNSFPDKEGLFHFPTLCENFQNKRFSKGYLYSDTYMLMANTFFRRGFHELNDFAPRFIEFFWYLRASGLDTYIALDIDRVRIDVDEPCSMELDTWYGAPFNTEIQNIPNTIIKLRPPLDLDDMYISSHFANTFSLDIKWDSKEQIKTFQCEEFKIADIITEKNGVEYHPVRYIHAEFDTQNNEFRHFDGAIHFYTPEEYYARRDSDYNYNSKHSKKIKTLSQKLFKMNGSITTDMWVEFSCHFLQGNPLTFEYFSGSYPAHINHMLEIVRNQNQINTK